MTSSRQLHLGAFMRPASIHTGAWRYPGAWLRSFAMGEEKAQRALS
jgi:hypothetical protein